MLQKYLSLTPFVTQVPKMSGSTRPSLFIASSSEQLKLAYAVQQELEHDADPTVWKQGIFKPSQSTLDSLMHSLSSFDFGVFVFAPDDVTSMRGNANSTVRDNVIFELGLFIGQLGRRRCFIIVPRGAGTLHLPTDLIGFTPLEYNADRSDGNVRAALGPACDAIRDAVNALGAYQKQSAMAEHAPMTHPVDDTDNTGVDRDDQQNALEIPKTSMAAVRFMKCHILAALDLAGGTSVEDKDLPAKCGVNPPAGIWNLALAALKNQRAIEVFRSYNRVQYMITERGRELLQDYQPD